MNVPHLEAGALTVEAAGPQGAEASLVGELGERIGLIDDL